MNTLKSPSITPNESHSIPASMHATPQICSHTRWRVWTSLQPEGIDVASDIAPGSLRDSIRIIGMNRIQSIWDALCRMQWFLQGTLPERDMKRLQENMSALYQEKEALQHMVREFSQKSPPVHILRWLYNQKQSINAYMNVYTAIRDIHLHSEEITHQIQRSEAALQRSSLQEDRTPSGGWMQRTLWWLKRRLRPSSWDEQGHNMVDRIRHLKEQLRRNEAFLQHMLIPEEKRQRQEMQHMLASFAHM